MDTMSETATTGEGQTHVVAVVEITTHAAIVIHTVAAEVGTGTGGATEGTVAAVGVRLGPRRTCTAGVTGAATAIVEAGGSQTTGTGSRAGAGSRKGGIDTKAQCWRGVEEEKCVAGFACRGMHLGHFFSF